MLELTLVVPSPSPASKKIFFDLELTSSDEVAGQLRRVGGNNGVSGRGCLVFYAKDINGKVKAIIIEPKGSYLEDPPAQFRILGQQRMKKLGVCAIQDYDDAGTDIIKCKGSGIILPLTEGGGLLLLYYPNEKLKQQLRNYIMDLKKSDNFLPHVVDLEELNRDHETVLIMNEGNLKTENYERLLHWRFGHASSKVLKAMDLIDKTHLNEDC